MIRDKKNYNVLIVEDNPGDFALVDDFLREQILTPNIVHAVNYKQAESILSDAEAFFDVILLDLSLPDKNGENLVTGMLQITRFPIIVLTGYGDMDFSIRSISQGIFDYLLKDDLNAITLYKSILYAIERSRNIIELKKSERYASDLFNLSPQPMWVYDPFTYRFIQVNKAAIEYYGYSNEEFMGMTILDIRPADDILKIKEIIEIRKTKKDELFKGNFRHCKKNGEIIEVEVFSSPITINDTELRSVIAVDVTERNLYEQMIMKAIIKTQEDERYEIGGELHDNVCQILAVSQLNLGILRKAIAPSKIDLFDQCREHLKVVLDEIRNLSHRLAPAFFEHSNLEESFQRLFKTFNFENTIEARFYFDEEVHKKGINQDIQLHLYRILQEQLRNIQKYSEASEVEVDVLFCDNKLKMRISDNGVGFNVNAAKDGIGISNMRRRTELFLGKFDIESSPCKGCTINIEIPLPEKMK